MLSGPAALRFLGEETPLTHRRRVRVFALLLLGAAACGGGDEGAPPADLEPIDTPDVILDGGGEIPEPPDGPALCPTGRCNYQTGDGCDESAPACLPTLDANDEVVPACSPAGKGESGAACASFDACVPGYLCVEGTCKKLCCGGDWTACPSPDERCIEHVDVLTPGGETIDTGAMVCAPVNACDALAPSSCEQEGETCQIVDPTGATACAPEGTGVSGEPCPCKGGFFCVAGECRRLCKAVEGGGDPKCAPGEGVCIHFNRDPPGVGECTPQ